MNQEHVDKLLEGVEVFNAWRESNPNVTVDLTGADLPCPFRLLNSDL
jgi:hypothetical protein